MLEMLLTNYDLIYAILGLLYAAVGLGFVLGRFSTQVMFDKFTYTDFKDAMCQLVTWLLVVYRLDKDRKKNLKMHRPKN